MTVAQMDVLAEGLGRVGEAPVERGTGADLMALGRAVG